MVDTTQGKPSAHIDAEKAAKKALLKAKKDFSLHVGLVERQDGLTLSDARATAYVEGAVGLAKRLGKPVLL